MSGLMPTSREQQLEIGSPEIRRMLNDFVKRRVPDADVDDVVQTVLVEALASDRVPTDKVELRKWLTGVARHKIADLHRKGARERPAEIPDIETAPPPVEEHELVRWAEEQAKQGGKEGGATLRWMAREGEGDKLEHIAAEEKLPAATVRQRVSRMRRFMKERWLAEIAAAALVVTLLGFALWRFVLAPRPDIAKETPEESPPPKKGPPIAPSPLERAAELRRAATESCAKRDDVGCEQALDEAKRLDPAGEASPEVKRLRDELAARKAPPQSSSAAPGPDGSALPEDKRGSEEKGSFGNGEGKVPIPTTASPKAPPRATSTGTPTKGSKPSSPKESSFDLTPLDNAPSEPPAQQAPQKGMSKGVKK